MPHNETQPLPMADIIVLQGDDELAIGEALKEWVSQIGTDAFAGMNTTRLDGRAVTRAEITTALTALPLGSTRRLVVLDNPLEIARGKENQGWLALMLKELPPSTGLVLVIADTKRYKDGRMQWEAVGEGHWLRQAVKESGKSITWLEKNLPGPRDMPDWIRREAATQGVRFEDAAAVELTNLIGVDVFLARQEIAKMGSYVGKEGTVTRQVVRLLCSQTRMEDIFSLVDALGARDGRKALGLLNSLLVDQPTQYIFSMVARQVRLLLIAKEVSAEGGGERDLVAASGVHPFVARKLLDQCRRFSAAELKGIYRLLDDLDEDSKTGKASLDVGLETLLARLTRAV